MPLKYSNCTLFTGEIEHSQTQNETQNEDNEADNAVIQGASAAASSHLDVGMKSDVIVFAVALYSRKKIDDDELSFIEGETLDIIEFTSEDWWLARNNIGETGLVPSNHLVKLLSEGM